MYKGTTNPDETRKVVVVEDGEEKDLPLRLDLANHSPDGFNWGYGGSGPSQLALAILAYHTTDSLALEYYQQFKWSFLFFLHEDSWCIIDRQISTWLSSQQVTPQ